MVRCCYYVLLLYLCIYQELDEVPPACVSDAIPDCFLPLFTQLRPQSEVKFTPSIPRVLRSEC
jgi:hypothetical protein